ncbi:FUSC family protein [Amnibacterium endophyticum]|uniref:Aromatic acid exporter family protein n=1 Tax=Amnibacterium endophyticum TaxID=2109337 RepID=A0ABW4LCW8_9MICO
MSPQRAARLTAALDPRAAARRAWEAVPAAGQLAVAATAAYCVAHFALGRAVPLLAITVCLSSLGFVRDARPRRVLETAFGLSVGVALAEVVLVVAGRGVAQILIALFVTLLVARALQAPPAIAVAATAQSAIVLLLQLPAGGTWARSVDGLVGGGMALLATALLPRDPRHAAQRDADVVFAGLRRAIDDLARAFRTADPGAAASSLATLRALQPAQSDWTTTVDSAVAIARISPLLHGRLDELRGQRRLVDGIDLAVRSLRTIARRAEATLADGRPRPELAQLVSVIGQVSGLLGRSVREPGAAALARRDLVLVAERLDPRVLTPGASVSDAMITVLVRPIVVDLAVAAGDDAAAVRSRLPVLG